MDYMGFSFGALDFSAGEYGVTKTNAFGNAQQEFRIIKRAREHGSLNVFKRFESRYIDVEGIISTDTSPALREAIDALNVLMSIGKRELRVTDLDSAYREWSTAELKNVVINRSATDVTRAVFSLEFYSDKPFAVDGNTDTLIDDNMTDSAALFPITVLGSYPGSPAITLTVNDITPDDEDVSITISNPSTSESMTITETLAIGDIITIDMFTKLVYLNTTQIVPQGNIPAWIPGGGNLEYSDTADTRDIDIVATLDRRYL